MARYSLWQKPDVEVQWPPGSWKGLSEVSVEVTDDYLVVDVDSEIYKDFRRAINAKLVRHISQRAYGSETKVSTAEKAARLAKSVYRDPAGLLRSASNDEIRFRLKVCADCEWIDPARMGCKICGCTFKNKLTRRAESCPIHEWKLAHGQDLTSKEQKERAKELAKIRSKHNATRQKEKQK